MFIRGNVTYLLNPWSSALFEKLTGSQLVKKYITFYGTRRFFTAFTSARHLSLSWARSIQSMPRRRTSWRFILILSFHLRLGLLSGLFTSLKMDKIEYLFFCGAATQWGSWPPHAWGFLDHTQRRTTVGRTPLDWWSVRRRYVYLTTHNTHNRQTSMPPVGFEPTVSASEWPQTYILDRAATGIGPEHYRLFY